MTYMTDAMRAELTEQFAAVGATAIDLPVLFHADVFVDLIGEDIRRRLYVAPGANGEAMALRPEFTIPACLHHLSSAPIDQVANYACVGPVFRQRGDDLPGESWQAGLEQFDPEGGVSFDANSLTGALKLVESLSNRTPIVTIGDNALFSALLTALETPTVWQRRLEGAFGDRTLLDKMLKRLAQGGADDQDASAGLARILEGKDPAAVRDAVEEMLDIAGLAAVGGRSVGDIAERYMEKAELAANAGWDAGKIDTISRYLAISGSLDDSLSQLQAFDAAEGNPLGGALSQFAERVDAIKASVASDAPICFKADFGRRLDYYSGFNYELNFEGEASPVAGGGRYDRLLGLLAPRVDANLSLEALPAIGFVIWLDRLNKAEG
ncbi:ATP phosphoribosyltransferase regulatory subunit [Cohaesibacter sp. CAU 1516]|uniref:ATP phosphoribosyltransferase regulatory subunit n=1 Tax=Cohaesibacter sp. CAU 1516 TaxID=2576038 RepID=UPI0010FEAC29|nr:ATP phosphoribosyltransferase regulatory subunit [Cohaesibacter sp. CAU 1516]TLP45617.1 ATP phosphoribosyltransferase regulatory subunit [Cohaesibacter sp. CAU 1516]